MKAGRDSATLTRRLRFSPPYDWPAILAFFRARAIQGVEEVGADVYRRAVVCNGHPGVVEVGHEPATNSLVMTTHFLPARDVQSLRSRVGRVFDIAANSQTIHAHLSRDAALAPFVAARPGLRVPGGWSDLEIAVRAILGQQITVVAARQLAGRLVALCGDAIPAARRSSPALSHGFPSARQIIDADLEAIGMPAARRAALKSVAQAALENAGLFRSSRRDRADCRPSANGAWHRRVDGPVHRDARVTGTGCFSGNRRRSAARRRGGVWRAADAWRSAAPC